VQCGTARHFTEKGDSRPAWHYSRESFHDRIPRDQAMPARWGRRA